MKLDFNDKVPIYLQIMDGIKIDIVKGKLIEGDKLPSVREMAEIYKVNPNTIQRTYQELEREGITYTQRGMGTFITENEEILSNLKKEMSQEIVAAFVNGMKELGFNAVEIKNAVKEYMSEEKL